MVSDIGELSGGEMPQRALQPTVRTYGIREVARLAQINPDCMLCSLDFHGCLLVLEGRAEEVRGGENDFSSVLCNNIHEEYELSLVFKKNVNSV